MTQWSTTTKHEPSSINKGNKYELKDRVSIEQLNNMTENAFYAMNAASDAKEKAEQALEHAVSGGSRVLENGQFVAEFNADKKADKTALDDYYTKEQVDNLLDSGTVDVDLSNYYTKDQTYSKQEVDDKLANLDIDIDFSDYYTKQETDSLLNGKANKNDIPTTASEVNALPDTTKYGASIDLSINNTTYVVTAQLKDQNGNNLGTAKTIDLPLESVVVSGSYDSTNKKVILTLKDGSTIDFSVADLVSGLQSEITSTNKLSVNLISGLSTIATSGALKDATQDTNNRTVTDAEKTTWNNKANKSDIPDISGKADQTALDITNATVEGHTTEITRLGNTKADKSALYDYLKFSDIEDSLGSTSTRKVLSANQGSVIKNNIINLMNNKADKTEIPLEYLKQVVINGNLVTITDQDGRNVTFASGGGSKIIWEVWE